MDIYVAGKTDDWERVRRVQEMVGRLGHSITFDWTAVVEEVGPDANVEEGADEDFRQQCAESDLTGVREADLVIALVDHPGLCGTLIEIGIAIACDIDVLVVGEPERNSVFFALDKVQRVRDEFTLVDLLPVEK